MFQTLSDTDSNNAALEIQCRAPYNVTMPLDSVSNTQLNSEKGSSSSSSSDCCAGQRSTPHSRTLEVRPGRITKKLGLRYDCDCERDETKSLIANDE